jgi:CDGSH-type Zn-finger protein
MKKTEKSKPASKSAAKYKITIVKDGPYLVSGGVPLSVQTMCIDKEGQCHGWKESKKFPLQEDYALCRCGHSKNPPFCDGAHTKIKFNGTETAAHTASVGEEGVVEGPTIKLTDIEGLCASARFCHRDGGTWHLAKHSETPEARQTAIEEAWDCPSGRLVVWDKDGKAIEPDFEPSIGLVEDVQAGKFGPLWVRGGIPVEGADGKTYEIRNRVTLCRCGKSQNKPFCDGRHLK